MLYMVTRFAPRIVGEFVGEEDGAMSKTYMLSQYIITSIFANVLIHSALFSSGDIVCAEC